MCINQCTASVNLTKYRRLVIASMVLHLTTYILCPWFPAASKTFATSWATEGLGKPLFVPCLSWTELLCPLNSLGWWVSLLYWSPCWLALQLVILGSASCFSKLSSKKRGEELRWMPWLQSQFQKESANILRACCLRLTSEWRGKSCGIEPLTCGVSTNWLVPKRN